MSRIEDDSQYAMQQTPARSSAQPQETNLSTNDLRLVGVCVMLFVACVYVFFWQIVPKLGNGPHLSAPLFFSLLIYLLCVAAGWLWGRYQSQTVAHKENLRLNEQLNGLKTNVERLESERYSLQAQLRNAQAAIPARTSQGASASQIGLPAPIMSSKQPPPNIYESAREPEDTSDLLEQPHERIFPARNEANSLRYGWRIIGASRRGFSHAYEGKYREDDFNVRFYSPPGQPPDIAIVAIADGVSSKGLSRRGARAAVLGATELPEQRMKNLRYLLSQKAEPEHFFEESFAILLDALATARRRVEERAAQSRATVDELQSTLLAYLAMPLDENRLLLASTQIGDGALFLLQHKQHDTWNFIQPPQIQGAGNEVHPFMRSTQEEWEKYFRCVAIGNARCIMGMTDGTADDIEPPRATRENPNPDPFGLVNDFYQRIVQPAYAQQAPSQPAEELVKLLGYRKKTSHDDRTVVCLYRQ